jgi:hypothetical protein
MANSGNVVILAAKIGMLMEVNIYHYNVDANIG